MLKRLCNESFMSPSYIKHVVKIDCILRLDFISSVSENLTIVCDKFNLLFLNKHLK